MSIIFPRFAFAPVRCAPIRHEISPLWSLFDDATRQIQQIERQTRRKPFNPRFDLKEDKESYVLEGEVPGFNESDLSIEWNDNVLAIRGRHETVTESGKKPEEVAAQATPVAETETPASDAGSVKSQKSHQATVEDEEPANSSAVAESAQTVAAPQPAEQAPVKTEAPVQNWISERRTGQFLRQFAFPSNKVDHEAIKASLQSGILKIVVPKAAIPASRHINIE